MSVATITVCVPTRPHAVPLCVRFLLFWPSEMEKYCWGRAALWCRGEAESSRSLASGKKKMEPRALETQPKMTSFWVGLNFF